MTSRENKETKLNRFWPRGAKLPTVFCNVVGSEEEDVTGTRDESRVGIESKSNNAEAQKAVSHKTTSCTRGGGPGYEARG